MSNFQEKLLFSERLKQALTNENHPISPTYLSREFNHRYDGVPVSVQSANNWISGKSIPSQDKLSLLAIWLNVSNQWLRFGDQEQHVINHIDAKNSEDLDYLLKFRALSLTQKKIIKALIDEFIH